MIRILSGCARGLIALIACAGMLLSAHADVSYPWTDAKPCKGFKASALILSCAEVRIQIDALKNGDAGSLVLQFPEIAPLIATRQRTIRFGKQAYTWEGLIDKETLSKFSLTVVNEEMVATFRRANGDLYRLRTDETGAHVVEQIEPGQFPQHPGVDAPVKPLNGAVNTAEDCGVNTLAVDPVGCQTDNPHRIDLVVAYTNGAKGTHSDDYMKAISLQAIWIANGTFRNSNIDLELMPKYVGQVGYTRDAMRAIGTILNCLVEDLSYCSFMTMDAVELQEVRQLRVDHDGDAVVLLVNQNVGGLSKIMGPGQVNDSFKPLAYGVLSIPGFADTTLLAHELGHILGADHDPDAPDHGRGAFPYSAGHCEPKTSVDNCHGWGTIMATASDKCPTHIEYWSEEVPVPTPWCGGPMGNAATKDNARTLRCTAPVVSHYRCGGAVPNNVWIKDGWEDTGAEPDPAMAGKPMYKSPYIWVRNSADDQYGFQHQHQDPMAHKVNHIYVKAHNSGLDATGDLMVYVASSSTGLAWQPGVWTLIGTKHYDGAAPFRGNSTDIAHIPWTPTLTGHFCLLVRWVSAQDPMTTETASIESNTRNNNNIAWRNLNVVEINPVGVGPPVTTIIANPGAGSMQAVLEFSLLHEGDWKTFAKDGVVNVKLSDALQILFKKDGERSEGIEKDGDKLRITDLHKPARIRVELPAHFSAPIELWFGATRKLWRGPPFQFDVQQYDQKEFVGGVGYELQRRF